MELTRLAARAKKNIPVREPGNIYGTHVEDMSFTRPSVSKGYGAVLSHLYAVGPSRKFEIQDALKRPHNHGSTTYQRLVAGKLVMRRKDKKYALTKLGEAYVKTWLEPEDL